MANNPIFGCHGDEAALTLNRPEAVNALEYKLHDVLENAVCNCNARAIFITGAGTCGFCAGDDVKRILSNCAPFEPERAVKAKAAGGVTPVAKAPQHSPAGRGGNLSSPVATARIM